MRASNSEQEVMAEAVLIRYTPVIAELMPRTASSKTVLKTLVTFM